MHGCRRLVRLVMVWWWQGPKLARILVLHDVIHGHARCLRLLLSLPLQLHLDRRGALVCVMLGIDSVEPTEKTAHRRLAEVGFAAAASALCHSCIRPCARRRLGSGSGQGVQTRC
jgi:hypothetical protein